METGSPVQSQPGESPFYQTELLTKKHLRGLQLNNLSRAQGLPCLQGKLFANTSHYTFHSFFHLNNKASTVCQIGAESGAQMHAAPTCTELTEKCDPESVELSSLGTWFRLTRDTGAHGRSSLHQANSQNSSFPKKHWEQSPQQGFPTSSLQSPH